MDSLRLLASLLLLASSLIGKVSIGQVANEDTFDTVVAAERPIPIALSLGQERQLLFPSSVWTDVPRSLDDVVEIEVVGRSVFIKPLAAFPPARVLVGNVDQSNVQFILSLDVGRPNQALSPIRILSALSSGLEETTHRDSTTPDTAPGPIALSRWMSHTFYAPERLHKPLQGVLPLHIESKTTRRLVFGDRIDATPIGAWKSGDWYLTAVAIRNTTLGPWEWDPRELRGQWLYATPQHSWLGPTGQDTDTSAIYLISARPWASALPLADGKQDSVPR